MVDFSVSTRAGAGSTRPNDLYQVVDASTGIPYVAVYGGAGGSTPVTPTGITITQSTIALSAATSAPVVAANATRKYLAIQVVATGDATISTATPAVMGVGQVLNGAAAANKGGGYMEFTGIAIPTNAFYGISTAGSTLIVWEG